MASSKLSSLIGTLLSTFRIGLSGPMLKASADSKLTVRNVADTAFRRMAGATAIDPEDFVTKAIVDSSLTMKVGSDRSITTVEGIQGGGSLAADREFKLNVNGLTAIAGPIDPAADFLVIYDTSAGLHRKVAVGSLSAGNIDFQMAIVGALDALTLPVTRAGIEIAPISQTITRFRVMRETIGLSGTTTVELEVDGVVVAGSALSFTPSDVAYAVKTASISVNVISGNVISLKLTAAEVGAGNLYAVASAS